MLPCAMKQWCLHRTAVDVVVERLRGAKEKALVVGEPVIAARVFLDRAGDLHHAGLGDAHELVAGVHLLLHERSGWRQKHHLALCL